MLEISYQAENRSRDALRWMALTLEFAIFLLSWDLLFRLLWRPGWLQESILRSGDPSAYLSEMPAKIIATGIAVFLLLPAMRALVGRWRPSDFGLAKGNHRQAIPLAGFVLLALCLVSQLGSAFVSGSGAFGPWGVESLQDGRAMIWISVWNGGVVEEVVFRSYLQGSMAAIHPSWGALASVSVFCAYHGSWYLALGTLFGGLLFMLQYRMRASLPLVMLSHGASNAVSFGMAYLVQLFPAWRLILHLSLVLLCLLGLVAMWRTGIRFCRALISLLRGLRQSWRINALCSLVFLSLFLGGRRFLALQEWEAIWHTGWEFQLAALLVLITSYSIVLSVARSPTDHIRKAAPPDPGA